MGRTVLDGVLPEPQEGGRPFLRERLRDSVEHWRELEIAAAYGIPRSRLLGREPATITRHHYNKKGLLVRSVTVREPEWTEEDLGWAAAYLAELAERCPGCRLPLSETTAMEDGGPVHSYRADEPSRCYGCDAIARAVEQSAKIGTQRPHALLYQAQRVCSC